MWQLLALCAHICVRPCCLAQANVANFVESEQVVEVDEGTVLSSFVQVRAGARQGLCQVPRTVPLAQQPGCNASPCA